MHLSSHITPGLLKKTNTRLVKKAKYAETVRESFLPSSKSVYNDEEFSTVTDS